ncbi:preprotein translocase subunit SecA [Parvibium lacunae]|uniref:Protein translocase subunit SecA n=1 Tax=Parvibium lacunae TaxID=1888893 RepID=A0A368L3C9_9BURK|nr:preprotein translocase subunit SecA [Parvibium lacunae]
MNQLLKKIFGSRNERLLRQYQKTVDKINALEPTLQQLDDAALQAKTAEFRQRYAAGESLDQLLPEAFAVVREASRRVMGMRHFDVQLIGGMVLHHGKIAEMRTGEGKTLTATLAVYLNAIPATGVHVVTVNDYLAARDAEWMGKLYSFLGLSVGVILSQQPNEEKKAAYAADITYGTNNEFGFDYLRDNMEHQVGDRRQRQLIYAIVDEVDSILIDEARTPLIISGPAEDHTELYVKMNAVPPLLTPQTSEPKPTEPEPPGDYWVDEKGHQVHISEAGHEKAEQILANLGLLPDGASLYDPQNILLFHHLNAALRAHTLFHKDTHYVVQAGEVIIVDEFTGRLMPGRRWSDGLHQAIEAKEGAKIQAENQTLASITFQNYFRMYGKLAGMTGTADTEAYEFQEIYGLETVVIPTHKPIRRQDRQDQVYKSAREKYQAIIQDMKACFERGQPVLVGTTSIEQSELLSGMLRELNLPHEVLNAKQHAREAQIVAEAGRPKRITIATNMAGRGTDIVLGGNLEKQCAFVQADPNLIDEQKASKIETLRNEWQSLHDQVIAAGGLHIIGSERHESRRIDNQLRGRAGRQGDPGSSRFYLSMEDQLLRIFAGDRVRAIMERLKLPDGEPIEAGMVTRSIESAQRKVEARNFDIRKQLLEYDDVANDQRKVIYSQRNEILESENVREMIHHLRDGVFTVLFRTYVPAESMEEQWDLAALENILRTEWQLEVPLTASLTDEANLDDDNLLALVLTAAKEAYAAKVTQAGEAFTSFERALLLNTLDNHWREHLSALDHLRQGIHLRGYAQKNPKQEYKREAFELFANMLEAIKTDVIRIIMTIRIQHAEQLEQAEEQMEERAAQSREQAQYQHADADGEATPAAAEPKNQPVRNVVPKVGRNDPCPCGSGKKYKNCHGALA